MDMGKMGRNWMGDFGKIGILVRNSISALKLNWCRYAIDLNTKKDYSIG